MLVRKSKTNCVQIGKSTEKFAVNEPNKKEKEENCICDIPHTAAAQQKSVCVYSKKCTCKKVDVLIKKYERKKNKVSLNHQVKAVCQQQQHQQKPRKNNPK